ncbi:hypothetical protein POM88_022305 [Heracleum sosnowskyi]|uniref:Uncharacterized protein n=1 Tax=Heracleum sosnowskyi TaxID=360622 RepID=A0AAD8MPI8_9APIA|nr:hypothetical protein POM88_022305 [Heracleum sosnowskyi]
MENIAVILQHNGDWDENIWYINSEVYGLLIPNDYNSNKLVAMIYNELKLEPGSVMIRIEYQVRDGYLPFKITDDIATMVAKVANMVATMSAEVPTIVATMSAEVPTMVATFATFVVPMKL